MKTKLTFFAAALFLFNITNAQKGVVNNGAKMIISSGAYLNIDGDADGDFVNDSVVGFDGRLDLDGVIKLEGDWINNSISNNVLINVDTDGEVQFDGTTNAQSIDGISTQYFAFEKLTTGASADVEQAEDKDVTLSGAFTNDGSFTILSTATGTGSFIDNGTISGSGTEEVQLYLAEANRYYYVSSPISDAVANDEFSGANDLYEYNTSGSAWASIDVGTAAAIDAGQGYAVRYGSAAQTVAFTGSLNTGSTGLAIGDAGNNWWLVGNPYASTLNWEDLTISNVSTTMWYRTTHTGNSTRVFETYNGTTHIGTDNNGDIIDATQYIQPMQAVWVKVEGTSPALTAENADRSHTSQLFYKDNKNEINMVRLTVDYEGYTDETIIYFFPEATEGLDPYDSQKRFADDLIIPQLYTIIPEDIVAVMNGLPSLEDDRIIPLGFKTENEGSFTISASDFEGMPSRTKIYLEDLDENMIVDITKSDYTFESAPVFNNERFLIHFLPFNETDADFTGDDGNSGSTSTEEPLADFEINIYSFENKVYIKCNDPEQLNGQVSIVNMLGQELIRKDLENSTVNVFELDGNYSSYVVRILSNDIYKTQTIFLK